MKKPVLFLLLLIFSTGNSQKFESQKLDSYFNALMDNHKVMGSFAISKDDEIIYTKATGFSDFEKNKQSNIATKYRIASITKTFTAVLVLKAEEKNQLKLSDKLSKYFPGIKNANEISLEMMLRHRSGIHNFTDSDNYWDIDENFISQKDLLLLIVKDGSDFKPDSKSDYSNSNFVLLAMILEKVTKKSYDDLILEQIIKPLELKNTSLELTINPDKNEALSYVYLDKSYQKSDVTNLSISLGAGNISSTPSDLLTFIIALQNEKLINSKSLEKMKTLKDNYGLGLYMVPFNSEKGFGHNGKIDDFRSVLYYFPESKVGFAMITNQSDFDNNEISITALQAANNLKFDLPDFSKIIISPEDLQKFTGVYSHADFPFKIEVFVRDNLLFSRATGQSEFPLEATSQNSFQFKAAGIKLSFNTKENTMEFTQGSNNFTLTKEK